MITTGYVSSNLTYHSLVRNEDRSNNSEARSLQRQELSDGDQHAQKQGETTVHEKNSSLLKYDAI